MRSSRGPWSPEFARPTLVSVALSATRALGPLLRLFRVDVVQLLAVLELRLLLDLKSRRETSRWSGPSIGALLAVFFFFMGGFGTGLMPVLGTGPAIFAGAASALLMFMLLMVFMLQFAAIFVDPTDLGVLAPLPIDSRTLFTARLTHAATYVCVLGGTFAAPSTLMACVGYRSMLPLVAWPLCIACATLSTLGFVALVHAVVLRVLGPERFQRATFWLQIAFMTLFIGGFQWLQVMIPVGEIVSAVREHDAWLSFLPPVHISGLFTTMVGEATHWTRGMGLVALGIPPVALGLTLLFASRDFAAALAGEFSPTRGRGVDPRGDALTWTRSVPVVVRRWWGRGEERAGFGVAWALGVRDRMFLRATVPALAATTMPLFAVSVTLRRADIAFGELLPILVSYFLALSIPTTAEALRATEDPRAAWILHSLPLSRPGEYVRGAVKSALLRWMVPMSVLLILMQLAFLGPKALCDAPLALGVAALIGVVAVRLMKIGIPFSFRPTANDFDVTNLPIVLGLMVWCLVAAALHSALYFWTPAWFRLVLGVVPWLVLPGQLRRWRDLTTRPLSALRP